MRTPAHAQRGYNLVELMVSLALGLVIVAAAAQLMLANQMSFNFQRGSGDVQTGGRLATDMLMRDIRLAGLPVDGEEIVSGIVLATGDLSGLTNTAWASQNGVFTAALSPSDQLTVQYAALTNTETCEGVAVAAGNYVISRYYLRNDPDTGSIALVCDGAWRTPDPSNTGAVITGLGSGDAVVMSGVESFQVMLGLDDGANGSLQVNRYVNIATYNDNTAFPTPKPRVVAVRIGLLVRSQERVGEPLPPGGDVVVLDTTIPNNTTTQTPALADGRLRRLFVATAGLRNVDATGL